MIGNIPCRMSCGVFRVGAGPLLEVMCSEMCPVMWHVMW